MNTMFDVLFLDYCNQIDGDDGKSKKGVRDQIILDLFAKVIIFLLLIISVIYYILLYNLPSYSGYVNAGLAIIALVLGIVIVSYRESHNSVNNSDNLWKERLTRMKKISDLMKHRGLEPFDMDFLDAIVARYSKEEKKREYYKISVYLCSGFLAPIYKSVIDKCMKSARWLNLVFDILGILVLVLFIVFSFLVIYELIKTTGKKRKKDAFLNDLVEYKAFLQLEISRHKEEEEQKKRIESNPIRKVEENKKPKRSEQIQ